MIITISGEAGSGKSTISKIISEKLNLKQYSTGTIQRKIANEMGISIVELGEIEKQDKSIDNKIDLETEKIGKEENNFLMDSWLAAKFIPQAYKIFLKADIENRVKRRLNQKRKEENFYDFEIAKKQMLQRENTNQKRWIDFYNFDYKDEKNYDLIIDTTNMSVKEVVDFILKKLRTRT